MNTICGGSLVKAIAINGSPRRTWNTATMIEKALEGAAAAGAEIELIHLVDLDFKGCMSCFGCKRIGNPHFGKCNYHDALTPVLEKASEADVLLLGSPIYIGEVTGMMRNFIERFTFQYISYDEMGASYFKGKINCGSIFTMNCPKQHADIQKYAYDINTEILGRLFGGKSEYIMANETWQFTDYSKVAGGLFDVEAKKKLKEEVWPNELQAAYDLGRRLVETL
jgi:multimeric flavodoxin WrbA